jgi:inactivated superfamily I helicase
MSNSPDELDSRMDDIKQSIKLLTQLALRADERMAPLEEAQANSERKIGALADAQIRTEEAQANSERKVALLIEAQVRTEESAARLSVAMEGLAEKMSELAAAQAHTDQRLDALIDIVRERLGGQPQS